MGLGSLLKSGLLLAFGGAHFQFLSFLTAKEHPLPTVLQRTTLNKPTWLCGVLLEIVLNYQMHT